MTAFAAALAFIFCTPLWFAAQESNNRTVRIIFLAVLAFFILLIAERLTACAYLHDDGHFLPQRPQPKRNPLGRSRAALLRRASPFRALHSLGHVLSAQAARPKRPKALFRRPRQPHRPARRKNRPIHLRTSPAQSHGQFQQRRRTRFRPRSRKPLRRSQGQTLVRLHHNKVGRPGRLQARRRKLLPLAHRRKTHQRPPHRAHLQRLGPPRPTKRRLQHKKSRLAIDRALPVALASRRRANLNEAVADRGGRLSPKRQSPVREGRRPTPWPCAASIDLILVLLDV